MILQPIVENAIQHGIRNIPGQGKISLSVFKENEDVLIRIADNGVGMTREQIEKIYEGKEDDKPAEGEHGGVGLKNVMGRLKLSFDREDVFVIESEGEGKGTVVTLRIPIEGEENDKEDNKEK
jgi:sensor histidine kinase YesM